MIRDMSKLSETHFDVLVMGGGIYGAWVAYDASLRGLRVALVEKKDWASGTSSASSKLIHGGLRYLEHFEISLVKKALEERKRLARLAPHRVRPLRFLVPIFRGHRVGPWRMRMGLWLYDRFAGEDQHVAGREYLSAEDFVKRCAFIKADRLRCGFSYWDCQTDDALLTLEIVMGAYDAGAVVANYAEGTHMIEENGQVIGAAVRDNRNGACLEVRAKCVVGATGPWLREQHKHAEVPPRVRLTKGVHLVMPALSRHEALLLTARQDGRVFFIIPWYGRTLIGTTDTDYQGHPDDVKVDDDDIDYLLREANQALSGFSWSRKDIYSTFVGLRAMRDHVGRVPSALSREWGFEEIQKNYFISIGGKLTSARADAAMLVDHIERAVFQRTPGLCPTETRPLPWAPQDTKHWQDPLIAQCQAHGVDAEVAESLAMRYGVKVGLVLSLLQEDATLSCRIVEDLPFIYAEIVFACRYGMAVSLEDVLRRRIPLGLLTCVDQKTAHRVAVCMGRVLQWTDEHRLRETETML